MWSQMTKPGNFIFGINTAGLGSANAILPSPLFALANNFANWRGGFKFTIKLPKTKFHTGRLLLSFNPCGPAAASWNYTAALSTNNFISAIWDLKESNTFEFDVPYVHPAPYCSTNNSIGTFAIQVLENFKAPATVASSITGLVCVSALPGFEFSGLDCPYTVTAGPTAAIYQADVGPSSFCVGEKLRSIKQIISRATPVDISAYVGNLQAFAYQTWTPPTYSGTTPSYTGAPDSYSVKGLFVTAYAFAQGGTNFTATPNAARITAQCSFDYRSTTLFPTNPTGTRIAPLVTESIRSPLRVKLPAYNYAYRMLSGHLPTIPVYNNLPIPLVTFLWDHTADPNGPIMQYSASDDFRLGYFIGFAPLEIPTAASQTQANKWFALAQTL
jgi:hypothetical protein